MSAIAFNSGINVQSIDSSKTIKTQNTVTTETRTATLSEDQVNISIKRGVLPTFKGAGAGLLAGAAGGAMLGAVVGGKYASIGAMIGGGMGAVPGAIVGAATANITDSPWKGALGGAAVGGIAGATLALVAGKTFDPGSVALYAGVGAVSGLAAGLSGALVAQRK